jgi:hypothetical protein
MIRLREPYWLVPVVPPAVVLSAPEVVAPEVAAPAVVAPVVVVPAVLLATVAPAVLAVLVEPVVGPFTVPPTFVADESEPSVLLGVDVCTSLLPQASSSTLPSSRAASAK